MPDGAVYVGRPTKWGNPFRIRAESRGASNVARAAEAVERYRYWLEQKEPDLVEQARAELAGRDLVCWCPLDQPCHADVLLEVANG